MRKSIKENKVPETTKAPDSIRLSDSDNVIVALQGFSSGDSVKGMSAPLGTDIPSGHKIAFSDIPSGANVIRYGQIIGSATADIRAGDHVHTHNCGMDEHVQDYAHSSSVTPLSPFAEPRTFQGYHRQGGRVGTRNYVGIITSVNCSGSVARFIAEAAEKSEWFAALENVDGIVPLTHSGGCGMGSDDEGYRTLFRTLSGYAQNPNFAGILLLGLGCEVMQVPDLVGQDRLRDDNMFKYMVIQSAGGTRKTVEQGVEAVRELALQANKCTRESAPLSELVIGMQCGGSDGLSGITANPALGVASDLLVRNGGTTILSETSEIYGAEHLLTRRAETPEIGKSLIERIFWWEDYTSRNKSKMDNNPSPGNKRGGLTTILEKSLGAVAKSGSAPLSGVYKYGEKLDRKGFVFMDSPGYDPCSVTGQIASGANLICFTTGRGSVSGYQPTPCIKVASNDDLFSRLGEDIDLNCGDIISRGVSLEDKGSELFELFVTVASGEHTKSEALGFGAIEFVPWQIGAVV
ncbi:MAG: altronate dehydratase [Rhodobacteraceae bacterium]|nr:altronate dehydratase [Paracoccaceae bacterium]